MIKDEAQPIYVQIAGWLENEILHGRFRDDQKVYSQYQLADMFNINPATAAKGLNMLVEDNILYKKRGLGMFVKSGAQAVIRMKRKNKTLKHLILDTVLEAKRLDVSEKELLSMIQAEFQARERER